MLFITLPACAQRIDKPGEPYDYYIEVIVEHRTTYSIKALIKLPGDEEFYTITDEKHKTIFFTGLDDIINYMSNREWQYIDFKSYLNIDFLLFKKKITDKNQVSKNIFTDNKNGRK